MSPSRRGLPLEEQLGLERLLDEAFAPARGRTAPIAAARVRARVTWERPQPAGAGWRGVALLGRLGESTVAVGLTAVLFVGALGGVTGQTETVQTEQTVQKERGGEFIVRVSAPLDDMRFLRLLRLGRSAPVADYLDASTPLPVLIADEGETVATVRERQGLLR